MMIMSLGRSQRPVTHDSLVEGQRVEADLASVGPIRYMMSRGEDREENGTIL